MISTKKVSIITASFNNLKTIEDTLTSILSQSHNNIELIIIDGCSTDGTLDLIKKREDEFKSKLVSYKLLIESDDGIADAWNKGLKLATGEIIFFLNTDDWISENTVEKAVSLLDINSLELVYGVCNRVDQNKNYLGSFQKEFKKYRELWNFGFSFTTCFCTKKVYDNIGNFNTNYKIAIDSDFLLRCLKNKVKFVKGSQEVFMRIGGISTKHRLIAHKEYKQALIKNGYPKFLVNFTYFFFKFT
ncbi:glycosyltransferase family 2 protein [uncultured Polaribacter sp.]|uniref:glycosyltransferase family 2 protein n=1 Tax=uncultured Polaribacter sp. TaxID=174711 RepID=UPI00261DE3A2|nr:glycosyltransferase family 2 protein [uncultured Polaribacter sp.]